MRTCLVLLMINLPALYGLETSSIQALGVTARELTRNTMMVAGRYCNNSGAAMDVSCIPWAVDPMNDGKKGHYWSANTGSMLVTGNDTVVAFFVGAKYGAGFGNQNDLLVRRSFDQGLTWQPWQMVFSPSKQLPHKCYNAVSGALASCGVTVGTVFDQKTSTIHALITGNNTFVVSMSSSDNGATWSVPRDITNGTKPAGVGWVSTMDSGVQLASGRLAICMDYIIGQWASYPITHARSSVLFSDDHGASWQWPKSGGTADGATMTECSLAVLPNNTLVMNARNYINQTAHTVHRATLWSHDEGQTWSPPLYNRDLPSPVENGDMITAAHTDPSLGIGEPLLLTHPQSELDRANGTLLMSTTGGTSWQELLQYSHGCHASSQVVQFRDGKVGVLFDDGGPFPISIGITIQSMVSINYHSQ